MKNIINLIDSLHIGVVKPTTTENICSYLLEIGLAKKINYVRHEGYTYRENLYSMCRINENIHRSTFTAIMENDEADFTFKVTQYWNAKSDGIAYLTFCFNGLNQLNDDGASLKRLEFVKKFIHTMNGNGFSLLVTRLDIAFDYYLDFVNASAVLADNAKRKFDEVYPNETAYFQNQRVEEKDLKIALYSKTVKNNLPFEVTRLEASFRNKRHFGYRLDSLDDIENCAEIYYKKIHKQVPRVFELYEVYCTPVVESEVA
jgi:hypothetical protein